MRYAAFGLLPDFLRCTAVMGPPIRVIGVLVGVEVLTRLRSRKLARLADGAVRAFRGVGKNNLRAIGANRALALFRYVTGACTK